MQSIFRSNAYFFTLFFITVYSTAILSQEVFGATAAHASLKSNTIVKDLGQVASEKTNIEVVFQWMNNERETLEIEKVIKSCHCATVKPSEGKIKSGETVEFVANIDVLNWAGNAAIKFVVFFKNRPDLPVSFTAKFFKTIALDAKPKRLDFGVVDNPLKSFRTFKIVWVSDPNEAGLEVLPNIFSRKGIASCRLLNEKKETVRLPNAAKSNVRQEFLFEGFLNPQLTRGKFDDTIKVPVVLNGEVDYVLIPSAGWIKGKVFSTPSKIFSFITKDKIQETKIEATLSRQDWCDEPEDVNVTCSDSRLSVVLTKPKAKTDTKLVGTISITVQDPICSHAIETKLNISYKIGDKKENFDIPVKIIVIDGTVNGN